MKKLLMIAATLLLTLALLAGCMKSQTEVPADTAPSDTSAELTTQPSDTSTELTTQPSSEPEKTETEDDVQYEGDAYSYYIDVAYAEQISRYHTALSEKWEEGKYFENDMSTLPYYYYEENPLENVGFGFVDLDGDGHLELIIGAILNAEDDPAVFEIWTLVDGAPIMLAQGDTRSRYVLQYVEEDGMWYVVHESSNGADSFATYYLMLNEGKLEVMQGIVFDALTNEQNPWFMAYDMDWDTSNDDPLDEATANAILETNRKHYTALELFPYTFGNG